MARTPPLDAVVIGGRPAGAVCAATLAKQGRSVMVLGRRAFPRFHIGESMLPHSPSSPLRTVR
jgi:FADH2-dependent halogenase